MVNIQLLTILFFSLAAMLACVLVALARGSTLVFPILPVIRFVSTAPSWIICTNRPFSTADHITKTAFWILAIVSKLHHDTLTAISAFLFNLSVLRPTVTFCRTIFLSVCTIGHHFHWFAALRAINSYFFFVVWMVFSVCNEYGFFGHMFRSPFSIAIPGTKFTNLTCFGNKGFTALLTDFLDFHYVTLKVLALRGSALLSRYAGEGQACDTNKKTNRTAIPRHLHCTTIIGG